MSLFVNRWYEIGYSAGRELLVRILKKEGVLKKKEKKDGKEKRREGKKGKKRREEGRRREGMGSCEGGVYLYIYIYSYIVM